MVVSVSHGWPYQAHPDPFGTKIRTVRNLLRAANIDCFSSNKRVLLFFDWLSIPQRPFISGQADRTAEEKLNFEAAISEMHNMYFYADRIIHLAFEDPDESIEEETYEIDSWKLLSAGLALVGDQVQIVSPPEVQPGEFLAHQQPLLFDRLVDIDGEPVNSLEKAQSMLQNPQDLIRRTVKLRRQRFGRLNSNPADRRGWIFLERFITMVKCAMLDDAAMAQYVVISDSREITEDILKGADEMRRAAAVDDGGTELMMLLDFWKAQLLTKSFSATSTDRSVALEAAPPDQLIVAEIMESFVEFLRKRWVPESMKQRSRARRLKGMLEQYLLTWDRFSVGYISKLDDASTSNPLPAIILGCLPLCLTSAVVLAPLQPPDHPAGSHLDFFCFAWPIGVAACGYMFPRFLATAASVKLTWAVEAKLAAWTCFFAVSCVIVEILLYSHDVMGFNAFPMTFIHLHADVVAIPFFGLLWYCVPVSQRLDPCFKRKLKYAVFTLVAILAVFAFGFPILNAGMLVASERVTPLLACVYLLTKLLFEWFCCKMSKYLGADIMPAVIFLASYAYEMNLCTVLSFDVRWTMAIQMVGFDIVENCYHIYSFLRNQNNHGSSSDGGGDIESINDPGDGEVYSNSSKGHNYYLLAACLIRELLEIMVPLQYVTLLVLSYFTQPRFNTLICGMTPEAFKRTVGFLLMDIAVEVMVFIAMYMIFRRNGVRPFRLLRGFLATNLAVFLASAVCWNMYFSCLVHSHFGADMTLEFRWLRVENAQWVCGLRWTHGNA
jgi:hypothetical protein